MPSGFWDRYAFTVGGSDFQWIDVVLDAMTRGEWSSFERRLAEGLACVARAEREHAGPSPDDVDAAATAFRYDRDLIAGSEMTAWLDDAGVSTDEWLAYLTRQLLREKWHDELDDIFDAYAPPARDLTAAAVAEGVCSGEFEAFERRFAARAALVFSSDAAAFERICGRRGANAAVDDAVAHLMRTHSDWLAVRPADETAARLSVVVQLEADVDARLSAIACDDRMREVVEANRLEWIQVELETVSFPSAAAAREAMMCMAEDGMSLEEVAALSHCTMARSRVVLEDSAPEVSGELLAAIPGGLLGPHSVDGRFEVTRIVDRVTPTLNDARVAARARQALIDVALAHAARDHVTRRSEA
jgi:hypothetical protein